MAKEGEGNFGREFGATTAEIAGLVLVGAGLLAWEAGIAVTGGVLFLIGLWGKNYGKQGS